VKIVDRLAATADNSSSAGTDLTDLLLIRLLLRRAVRRVITISALLSTTVKLDAVTLAGDAIAIASARRGRGVGEGAEGGSAGGAGDIRSGDGRGWGSGEAVKGSLLELGSDVIDLWGDGVISFTDLAGGIGLGGLWADDAGGRDGAALGDLAGGALGGGSGGGLGAVEDVQGAAGGGLLGEGLGWVMGDVVAVHDVVVPVALASLESGSLEAEGSLPATGLSGVLGKRKLSGVVVP
jgi:hypothetical protein